MKYFFTFVSLIVWGILIFMLFYLRKSDKHKKELKLAAVFLGIVISIIFCTWSTYRITLPVVTVFPDESYDGSGQQYDYIIWDNHTYIKEPPDENYPANEDLSFISYASLELQKVTLGVELLDYFSPPKLYLSDKDYGIIWLSSSAGMEKYKLTD